MRWRNVKHKKSPAAEPTDEPPLLRKGRYARYSRRFLAFTTDLFMIGMAIALIIMIFFGHDEVFHAPGFVDAVSGDADAKRPDPLASVLQISMFWFIYVFFWRRGGQTPGKKMAGLYVVDARTFARASWLQLTVRFFGYILLIPGFFIAFFRKDRRALHDLISRTVVISE